MIVQALDKIKQQTIISSLLLMIVGLVMLIIPVQHDGILVEILGYIILLVGGVMIWDFVGGEKKLSSWILFTAALLLVVLGLFILLSGDDILTVLSVLFGILLIVDGLHSTVHAWMYARRSPRMDVCAPLRQEVVVDPAPSQHFADRGRHCDPE